MIDKLKNKRWILISGKGGTGKTVFASSLAVQFAKSGEKTLVVSIDPAHSLSDALKRDIGPEIRGVHKVAGLHALEFTPEEMYEMDEETLQSAIGEYKDEFGEAGGLFSLSPDEMMGTMKDISSLPLEFAEGLNFLKLFETLKDSEFDKIIFDTAPTGHTLKLLELPGYLDSLLGKIIRFRLKIKSFWKKVKGLFGGGMENPEEKTLELLEKLKDLAGELQSILTNEDKTEFISITIPTEMSILESLRLMGTLDGYNIPHHFLVVNQLRIYNNDGECEFCRNLSQAHLENLRNIQERFPDSIIRCVPYFSEEVRGIEKLRKFYDFVESTTPENVEKLEKEEKPSKIGELIDEEKKHS